MKKLFVIFFLCLTSCVSRKEHSIELTVPDSPEWYINDHSGYSIARIIVIDNCEYIIIDESTAYTRGITHKGNCKYCQERNKVVDENQL